MRIDPSDLQTCREAIRHGSLSFYAASRLLPARYRDPALVLYAFCRMADDAVDLHAEKAEAVLTLHDRLDRVYRGCPRAAPADRAFADVVEATEMPRALPEALLEGFAWDAQGRQYADLPALRAYAARVAASVGAMMCVLMGVRDRAALARATDLGVAMQLTNIARDVGEDACEGRLYLPLDWLAEAGIRPEALLGDPRPEPELRALVARLLREADTLYRRAETGIAALPLSCRPGIFAARHVYSAIGGEVRKAEFDSITRRARTGRGRKLALLALAAGKAAATGLAPTDPRRFARPLPETAFLVEAAATGARTGWSETITRTLADLKSRDEERRLGAA